MPRKDLFLAFLVVSIWGASFSVVKTGLEELPPLLFSAIRFVIVALPAIFITPFPRTSWRNVIAVGVLLGVVKFGLLFTAMETDVSAGAASLILQAQVLFTIGLSWFLLKETVSSQQLIGLALAVFGFFLFLTTRDGAITPLGIMLMLGAAVAWAGANIVMKRMVDVNLLGVMVWASLIPPAPLFILSYFLETSDPITVIANASLKAWASAAYMGYLSTLAAYALWGGLLIRNSAARAAPFALLIPIIGIAIASTTLGEQLRGQEILGTTAILAGLAMCVAPRDHFISLMGRIGAVRKSAGAVDHDCIGAGCSKDTKKASDQ